ARLVGVLAARRTAVARAIFAQASPFGMPVPRGLEICAPDLVVAGKLFGPAPRPVEVQGAPFRVAGSDVCFAPPEAYSIVHVRRARPPGAPLAREMRVHVLRDGPDLRVVGVER